ncbi:hypothetical protein [Pseudoalteromonas sp. PPB1]|uniref:hypothetical protein n=1 Tax=Pseudoalteromonas sp. PPB1 TaxID=2756136 RepID=UPI001890C0F9|nr:hypothetical protein [Pseudoalteromonas sp. PPB1]
MKKGYYTVPVLPLVLFSFSTLGFYNIYFYFKNICLSSKVEGFDLVTVAKSILYPIFCFKLLKNAESSIDNYNGLSAKIIFFSQIFFVFGGVFLGKGGEILGFFTFIPLIFSNNLFVCSNKVQGLNSQEVVFNKSHYFAGIIGSLLVSYCILYFYVLI